MQKRIFFHILIIMALFLFRMGPLSILPFIRHFDPLPLFIIYLSIRNEKYYELLAIFAGFLLDLNSSSAFGMHAAAMFFMAAASNYAYQNILASSHLFSVAALVAFSLATRWFLISAISAVLHYLKIFMHPGWNGSGVAEILYKEIIAAWVLIAFYYLLKLAKNKIYAE